VARDAAHGLGGRLLTAVLSDEDDEGVVY
jgi:hypothetical protein